MKPIALVFMVVAVAAVGIGPVTAAAGAAAPAAGRITTVAGGIGGPGPGRTVAAPPCDVTFAGGHVLFTDTNGLLRRLDPRTGWLTTLAGGPDALCGLAVDKAGDVAVTEGDRVRLISARTGSLFGQAMSAGHIYTVASGSLDKFLAATFDHVGNLVLGDWPASQVMVVAVRSGTFYGQAMTAGRVYAIAGTGRQGNAGNGGLPTKAELRGPAGVAVDRFGDIVIAENGQLPPPNYRFISRVLLVTARTGRFYGIAMRAGHIYQVAGTGYAGDGPNGSSALRAEIDVKNVGVDRAGNLLLVEPDNNKIRVVARASGTYYGQPMTAGHLYTVAGDGTPGFAGDGSPATRAELNGPAAVAVDAAGNLLIADTNNNRIRVVAARNGTFYGVPMTAGDIYTIAGDGTAGFVGDSGPALQAELNGPNGLANTSAGVLISDNSRLRLIT